MLWSALPLLSMLLVTPVSIFGLALSVLKVLKHDSHCSSIFANLELLRFPVSNGVCTDLRMVVFS